MITQLGDKPPFHRGQYDESGHDQTEGALPLLMPDANNAGKIGGDMMSDLKLPGDAYAEMVIW
jgi:hypothetical protein